MEDLDSDAPSRAAAARKFIDEYFAADRVTVPGLFAVRVTIKEQEKEAALSRLRQLEANAIVAGDYRHFKTCLFWEERNGGQYYLVKIMHFTSAPTPTADVSFQEVVAYHHRYLRFVSYGTFEHVRAVTI